MKTSCHGILLAILICALLPATGRTGNLSIEAEGGAVWFSQNDVRIPGDSGTTFDMLDLTGDGPDAYLRLYAVYDFNEKHAVRLTYAPVETEGTGTLQEDVTFRDSVFQAGVPTEGTYKFNTYRLTYRWTFFSSERWKWGFGAAALVRDADIRLKQGALEENRDDLGFVPLLHLYGAWTPDDHWSVIFDFEGAAAPQGRALDAALKAQYAFDSGWHLAGGYRTLEGGADNDSVYTFAWLHYLFLSTGYRF